MDVDQDIMDVIIARCHFELDAGPENFEWV